MGQTTSKGNQSQFILEEKILKQASVNRKPFKNHAD